MSMKTIIKDEDSFVSNTDAVIYAASDISGWTQSLISDPNIPNSSNSTSVDDLQQQISTAAAAGGNTDDDLVVSGSSFDRSKNNTKKSDQQEIRIFNVDFRALSTVVVCSNRDEEEDKGSESNKRLKSSAKSEFDGGLSAEIVGAANKETSVRLVNNLDTTDALVRDIRIRGGSNVIKNTLAISQSRAEP
ncbi:uncharacterized protein [Nicotiana sylvestris]|uniref:uncharacterized protein n=1 Tax=Nicotiana sylvestris TaxID=4096 RepID=UPI00388C4F34